MDKPEAAEIPGYDYGTRKVLRSPVTLEELRKLEEAVGWTQEDAEWLRKAAETLVPKAQEMIDTWRSIIGKQPQLLQSFLKPDGTPDDNYRVAVKLRFVQWISDLCLKPHDQAWLDYQEEIGRRHTPAKKNKTDHGHTSPVVPLRYTIGFSAVVITSLPSFLVSNGHSKEDIERMQAAWTRAVLLSIALWARPYAAPDLW
jgi:hypothetical protein